MSEANKTQVGGGHYKTSYEHWDFVVFRLGGRYFEGNITKYIARHRQKNGAQDVQKARHYLTKLIELYNAGFVAPPDRVNYEAGLYYTTLNFCETNGLGPIESEVMQLMVTWEGRATLNRIGKLIDALQHEYDEQEEARAAEVAAFDRHRLST